MGWEVSAEEYKLYNVPSGYRIPKTVIFEEFDEDKTVGQLKDMFRKDGSLAFINNGVIGIRAFLINEDGSLGPSLENKRVFKDLWTVFSGTCISVGDESIPF